MIRPNIKRIVAILSWLFIIAGIVFFAYPFMTDLYYNFHQAKLADTFEEENTSHSQIPTLDDTEAAARITPGGPMAVLEIPVINLSAVVIKGTSAENLAKGPGWYEESALPGHGNTAIAGHRSMYGGAFTKIENLKVDNVILLKFNGKIYRYKVKELFTIESTDWSVTEPLEYTALTLTTCHPEGSSKRFVVRASLVSIR
ncbi:MAG TPA: class E sortase [Syntrophomonadaceae bacterium]|nr:class E sortase [Syntrophomonadaceae bacterium]HPR94065.1 class E sortase [Syntrophomonadaceae bacterium]